MREQLKKKKIFKSIGHDSIEKFTFLKKDLVKNEQALQFPFQGRGCDKTLNQNATGMAQFPAPDGEGLGTCSFFNYSPSPWERVGERVQKKAALTLTELLIAIGVIAVVAAFTLPTFIHNHQKMVNDARYENIVAKMTQAVGMMKANGDLDQFDTTMDFVNVLKKYLKINKICEADKIAECWGSTIVHTTDGKDFDVSEARTRANLGLVDSYGSNPNVGLVLSDGTHMILSYDPSHQGLTMGDEVVTDENSDVSNLMKGLSFVTDVNGSRGPNKEKIGNAQHDVRGFNGATFSEACIDGFYDGNKCKAASLCSGFIDGDKLCNENKDACSGYIDTTTKACITNQDKIAECAYIDVEKTCHDSCDGTLYDNNTKCCATGNHISSDGTQCSASCSEIGELADINNSLNCVTSCDGTQVVISGQCANCTGTLYNNNTQCCRTDAGSYISNSGSSCVTTCSGTVKGHQCYANTPSDCSGYVYNNVCKPAYTGNSANCASIGGTYTSNKCFVYLRTNYNAINGNRWTGADYACKQMNMTLPSNTSLYSYCNNSQIRSILGLSENGYWSSTLSNGRAWAVGFDDCGPGDGFMDMWRPMDVLCESK